MSNLIYNERVKLAATLLNNLSVAVMAGGFFLPLFTRMNTPFDWKYFLIVLFAFGMGLVLHAVASWFLTFMKG